MRAGLAAGILSLAAACSEADEPAPSVTIDERRAVAEAREMIPQDEVPAATPSVTESATNEQ